MELGWKHYIDVAAAIVMTLLGIVYVAARLTLIIEVFTCLRSMPDGVYENVNWTTYIPHLDKGSEVHSSTINIICGHLGRLLFHTATVLHSHYAPYSTPLTPPRLSFILQTTLLP